jgi:hypothetical protein
MLAIPTDTSSTRRAKSLCREALMLEDDFCDIKEACRILNVSVSTLDRLARKKKLKKYRRESCPHRTFYLRADLYKLREPIA